MVTNLTNSENTYPGTTKRLYINLHFFNGLIINS